MPAAPFLEIRPVSAADEAAWCVLWQGYLDTCETDLSAEVYATTFARLLNGGPGGPCGFPALADGRPVGLVPVLFHCRSRVVERVCHLQHLFTLPDARGAGIGHALIEAVFARADRAGTPAVYRLTQEFNATVRRLYARVGVPVPFIEDDRPA